MTLKAASKATTASLRYLLLSLPSLAQKPSEIIQKYRAALKKTADADAVKTAIVESELFMAEMRFPSRLRYKAISTRRITKVPSKSMVGLLKCKKLCRITT
jgi:hypothetical protein